MLRLVFDEVIYIVDEGGSVEICVSIDDTEFIIDERLVFALGLAPTGEGTASGEEKLHIIHTTSIKIYFLPLLSVFLPLSFSLPSIIT